MKKNIKRAVSAVIGAGAALSAFAGVAAADSGPADTTVSANSGDYCTAIGGVPGGDCKNNPIAQSVGGIDHYNRQDSRDPSDRGLKADEVAIDWTRP
ncbi:hypothetical protein ACIBCO_40950 [Streptomyces violascens]|uniref:hypothetical protein n=1 Tax=Streptomyces violascens TaxID=67381 RepID=UPI0037A4ECE1